MDAANSIKSGIEFCPRDWRQGRRSASDVVITVRDGLIRVCIDPVNEDSKRGKVLPDARGVNE